MRRCERTCRLHVGLEVPELAQAHAGDVHDIGALGDGDAGVVSVRHLRAHGLDEACEVFVQGKESQQLRRRLPIRMRLAVRRARLFLVVADRLGVEVSNLEHVEGKAAARGPVSCAREILSSEDHSIPLISPARPLGVLPEACQIPVPSALTP